MVPAIQNASIRLLLVDDHDLVREGLKRILEATGEFEVVGEADSGDRALEIFPALAPDVVVTDVSMPGSDGIEATIALRSMSPHVRVVVLTMYNDAHHAVRALSAGAAGFVAKDSKSHILVSAIREVALGGRYLPPEIKAEVERRLDELKRKDNSQALADRLSKRELEVLRYLAVGKTNREIAERLGISVKTVDTHRGHLLKKLQLRNNADLTRFAIRHGLCPP